MYVIFSGIRSIHRRVPKYVFTLAFCMGFIEIHTYSNLRTIIPFRFGSYHYANSETKSIGIYGY
jgi:hypothetical protein